MRQPIKAEALAHLVERYGDRWKIWRSNPDGWYACASRRHGVSYALRPDESGDDVPPTLVEDSVEELAEALARADEKLLDTGAFKAVEPS